MAEFALNDRAANYGDAIFTTMSVEGGRIALYQRHLDRLLHNAKALGMELTDGANLAETMRHHAQMLQEGTLKLLVSAGNGGRGYVRPNPVSPSLHFSTHPRPAHYGQWRQHGIRLGLSPVQLAQQPLLAGLKHCNRLEQVLVKQAMQGCDVDDVMVCDSQGHIIEASAANVFWQADGVWHTPSLTRCGVAGVMREFILAHAATQGVTVHPGDYPLAALEQADAIFLSNALMQIVPVHTWQGRALDITAAHTLAAQLQYAYQDEYDSN